jgi:GNAT superfamily N-acetyltransferase
LETLFAVESQPNIQVLEDCSAIISAYPPGPSDESLFSSLSESLRSLSPGRLVGAAASAAVAKLLKKTGASGKPGSRQGNVLESLLGIASRREIAGAPGRALVGIVRLFAAMEAQKIAEPHFYVSFLAVRPERQGHGLARRLLGVVLDEADKTGVPCYADASSPESRRFAEHMGFEVRGELRPLEDGPVVWRMARPFKG